MKIIEETIESKTKEPIILRKLVADKGKQIRDINDIYEAEHIDKETGETIPEHQPYYTDIIYLGIQFNEKDLEKLYVEEEIKEEK